MPISKHRDNLSDLVDKAAKRRDRVNTRKRRMSSVHVSAPVSGTVIKSKEERRRQKSQGHVLFEASSLDGVSSSLDVDDESLSAGESGDPRNICDNPSSPSPNSTIMEEESYFTELYFKTALQLGFFSNVVYYIVEHSYWKATRMIFTCLAIYTLACEVSLLEGRQWSRFFYISNGIVNGYFVLDGMMKLWSFFGFLKIEEMFSAKNSWYASIRRCGIIDFSIASLCFYFASSFTGSWLKLIRVMFIALFGVQQLTSLDVLMSGIGFGLHSVFYTWLLLVLVFIVYGAAGVTFYAENDPYHFGTIAISMWTFFQISTLDDWIEVMLINSYGCDVYPVMYYPGTASEEIEQYGHFYLPVCTDPRQQRFVSIAIFFTFIVIVGFVLMSLTIAAVTAGINDRLDNLQKEELREELSGLNNQLLSREESNYESKKLSITGRVSKSVSNLLRDNSGVNLDGHLSADPALLRLMLYQALNVKKKSDFSQLNSAKRASKRLNKKGSSSMLPARPNPAVIARVNSGDSPSLSNPPAPSPLAASVSGSNKNNIPSKPLRLNTEAGQKQRGGASGEIQMEEHKIVTIGEVNENISSRYTLSSTNSSAWLRSPTARIVLDNIRVWREDHLTIQQLSLSCRNLTSHKSYNVLINLFIVFGAGFEVNSLQEDAFSVRKTDTGVNVALQIVFTIDIIIKVLAVFPTWLNFWKKRWNRFDVCTVFLLWVALAFNFPGLLGRVLQLLRVLRIFRILKLISKIPELHVIMMSIASSIRALAYIVALMFIFFFHFAVAGIYLFEANDPFHFQGLVRAFTTLFQVATLDNWGSVARINMLGCNNTEYDLDPPCTDPQGLGWIAAWYFIIFIILGVMVLLSLFVGVIITSMELLKEGLKEEREVLQKVRLLQRKYDITDGSVEHLLEIFDMIDVGSNGKLTLDELKPVLEIVSVTPVQQFEMFVQVDSDRSGQIDFSEFCELIQLIGKLYLESEEKKGARIIRRTRTYSRMSNINARGNKPRVKTNTSDVKYADSYSDNGSDSTMQGMGGNGHRLMRGGSSGSLVQTDWSEKDIHKVVDVNEYNDDDLDQPVEHRLKPVKGGGGGANHIERPRTNGGIWQMFHGADSKDSSPRTVRTHDDGVMYDLKDKSTVGNISGMSPVPSALDLLALTTHRSNNPKSRDKDELQHHAGSYVPVHRLLNDDDDEHHLHISHTASQKLNFLGGKSRPSSASRPHSGNKHVQSAAISSGKGGRESDAIEMLHTIPSAIELFQQTQADDEYIHQRNNHHTNHHHKSNSTNTTGPSPAAAATIPVSHHKAHSPAAIPDTGGYTHRLLGSKGGGDFSLADMSVHSLNDIDQEMSMFGNETHRGLHAKHQPTVNTTGDVTVDNGKGGYKPVISTSPPTLYEIKEGSIGNNNIDGLLLDSCDSRNPSMGNVAEAHYVQRPRTMSTCSDDVWEVGANGDPTAGLSNKIKENLLEED